MTLEVPNLFIILAFAFFFGPMFFLALYGCLASFWRVKRKKKERQGETYVTYEETDVTDCLEHDSGERCPDCGEDRYSDCWCHIGEEEDEE